MSSARFNPGRRLCPRPAESLSAACPGYSGSRARTVPACGDPRARLLMVDLALELRGAKRTRRRFCGDCAGMPLNRALHKFRFAARPNSNATDGGLRLCDGGITSAMMGLPPQSRLSSAGNYSYGRCLHAKLMALPPQPVTLALGRIPHDVAWCAAGLKPCELAFKHGVKHPPESGCLSLDSRHCSGCDIHRKNLALPMFRRRVTSTGRRLNDLDASA